MRILLVDVDSKIANLPLMKLSSYHKNLGDTVELKRLDCSLWEYNNDFDKCYVSIIFSKNKNSVVGNCIYGGVGYDQSIALKPEIEHTMPDYSLYPENKYSIGYLTRGCVRKCGFCVVPNKEGIIKFNANLDEFYNPLLPKIMLLDNNFLAYKDWRTLLSQLKNIKKKFTFKQGLDFRLLTVDKARELSECNYDGEYIFAFDNPKDFPFFEKNLPIYAEMFGPWKTKFYVLVGYNSSLKEDMARVNFLIRNKCLPYVMRYESCYQSEFKDFYTDLAAYCNQPHMMKKYNFDDFLHIRYTNENRISYSLDLWNRNS